MNYKIKKDLLENIFISVKKMQPREFMCFIGSSQNSNILDEIIFFPTYNNENSASIDLNTIPFSAGIIGSVHSHPNDYLVPSSADLNFFLRYEINIIFGTKNETNFQAFDKKGKKLELEVI